MTGSRGINTSQRETLWLSPFSEGRRADVGDALSIVWRAGSSARTVANLGGFSQAGALPTSTR